MAFIGLAILHFLNFVLLVSLLIREIGSLVIILKVPSDFLTKFDAGANLGVLHLNVCIVQTSTMSVPDV